MIPAAVERRARWVLDTLGARDLGFGDDLPYRAESWERIAQGERPEGDDLAEAFFHLARLEERGGRRDFHGRFTAASSALLEAGEVEEGLGEVVALDRKSVV